MKILKFKKEGKDKYKLFLDNNESISLYEDVIIKNNLLLSKEIENNKLDDLISQNNIIYAYNVALKYITFKMRSIKETDKYLLQKGFEKYIIKKVLERLIKEGYLNDLNFAKSFINDRIKLTPSGPIKIKKELLKYGVKEDIINSEIEKIDINIIEEKLKKLLEKQIKIKKGSLNSVKLKLINYFINLGYEKDMIVNLLSNYEIKSDMVRLDKDYDRLYNKYKNKYNGSELLYFISQKLYSKGYTSDDIKSVIKKHEKNSS